MDRFCLYRFCIVEEILKHDPGVGYSDKKIFSTDIPITIERRGDRNDGKQVNKYIA